MNPDHFQHITPPDDFTNVKEILIDSNPTILEVDQIDRRTPKVLVVGKDNVEIIRLLEKHKEELITSGITEEQIAKILDDCSVIQAEKCGLTRFHFSG